MRRLKLVFDFPQVKPPQSLGIKNVSGILTANDSSFNEAINNGDLDKAAQIANSVLQIISTDTKMDSQDKASVSKAYNSTQFTYKLQLVTTAHYTGQQI